MNPAPRHNRNSQQVALLRAMMAELYRERELLFHEQMIQFHHRLETRFEDCNRCLLVHVLTGSTPPGDCTVWDYEGEFSVERFIRNHHREVIQTKPSRGFSFFSATGPYLSKGLTA